MQVWEILTEHPFVIPTLYHGTTSLKAPQIERFGLRPQAETDSPLRGNASTIPGWTDHNVYLTSDLDKAARYAATQADKLGGDPVVYRVSVPDPNRLVSDDDYIQHYADHRLATFWDRYDSADPEDTQSALPPRMDPETSIHNAFFQDAKDRHHWSRSLRGIPGVGHGQAVAYRGRIPASFLSRLPMDDSLHFRLFGHFPKRAKPAS